MDQDGTLAEECAQLAADLRKMAVRAKRIGRRCPKTYRLIRLMHGDARLLDIIAAGYEFYGREMSGVLAVAPEPRYGAVRPPRPAEMEP